MFQIVVDTDTPPATPNYFADLEKTVPAPSVIPLVQGFRGKVRVYFVGEHIPAETAGLALYVRPMNQKGKAVETAVAPQQSDDDGNVFYDIDLVADTTALEVAIGARENVVMRGGLVAYDASVNPPTQIEWQMDLGVSASALGYGQTPPILPNAIEEHNLNESSHPFLLEKIRVLETEVSENNSELKTELSELEETVSENNSELKTEISELAGTVASNYSELSELAGTVASNHSELKTELSELAGTVATEISEITSELSVLEQTVSTNKSELKTEISENYSELKTEVSELAGTVACNYSELKTEISEVNSEVGVIKSNYVTLDTAQTITGKKTFASSPTSMQTFWGRASALKLKNCATPFVTITGEGSDNSEFSIRFQNKNGTLALSCELDSTASEIRSEISELETELSENYSELKTEISEVNSEVGVIKSNYVTLDTNQEITGQKVFKSSMSGGIVTGGVGFCGSNTNILGVFKSGLNANPTFASFGGGISGALQFPRCSGVIALTKNITTCTTAVKSELRCELPDVSTFATLTGNNTFTGVNTFSSAVAIECSFEISAGDPTIMAGGKSFQFPNTGGTFALTTDIPDTSGFAKLAVDNTFMGTNTFSGGIAVDCGFEISAADPVITAKGKSFRFQNKSGTFALTSDIPDTRYFAMLNCSGGNRFSEYNSFYKGLWADCGIQLYGSLAFCDGNPSIRAKGKEFYFPDTGGTLVVDTQLTNLTSNLSAICKTTVSNYGTITPTAGTLYFLTNS